MGTLLLDYFPTPIGELLLVTDGQGRLCALEWREHEERLRRLPILRKSGDTTNLQPGMAPANIVNALLAYFDGQCSALDAITVATAGTPFQETVWQELRRIPAGSTRSYGELAKAIGKPQAVRAVGAANGANPVSIVVPCHRVIGSNGGLTGYGGGLERKRWLLQHERKFAAHGQKAFWP